MRERGYVFKVSAKDAPCGRVILQTVFWFFAPLAIAVLWLVAPLLGGEARIPDWREK